MLRPSKHSHPDRTIISVAVFMLRRLKERRVEEFGSLLKLVKKSIKSGDVLFLPALNFLFLLGLIDYRRKTDSIEYLGKNETV